MSGKNLPSHCANFGPSFCSWQRPLVSMQTAVDARRHQERWGDNIGFLDPFHVVYCCLKRLKAATFVNVQYRGRMHRDKAPEKSQLCPGLQVYMHPMAVDEEVTNDVLNHIKHGSAENLVALIRNYECLEQVLFFLLKYLQERGPLLSFKYHDEDQLKKVTVNSRCFVSSFLTNMCEHELDFQAAVAIGDYLNFVLFVAYAHDNFWLKDLIVDLWSPLLLTLVNVGSHKSKGLTERQVQGKVKFIMRRLIESVPWQKLKTQENFKITINPDIHDSYLKRKATEAAREMERMTIKPQSIKTLLGGRDLFSVLGGRRTATAATEPSPTADADEEEISQQPASEREGDQEVDREENKDYSSMYNYSDEFKKLYAPHGMCKPPCSDT